MQGPRRPGQSSDRHARSPDSREQTLVRFQDRLRALERECQLFRTFSGWKDESHMARARELLRDLTAMERTLSADRPAGLQLALQQQNVLLRYQAFKRTYRQFWEHLTG